MGVQHVVGMNAKRVDAYEKVTGAAKYAADLYPRNALVAKVLHSTIANGMVERIDTQRAEALEGVIKVVTCFDVPQIDFPTAGHPWSTDPAHQDVADRRLLNTRVRYYGDDVAAVIAVDELTALKALSLIEVEYEVYKPLTDVYAAMCSGEDAGKAVPLHEAFPDNVLKRSTYAPCFENRYDEAANEDGLVFVRGCYTTHPVQHCHIEPQVSFAYMEAGRIVVVSSTQIPHICRRVIGQALGIPWGSVRVIKPYIGGGFGNKQDVVYEPLNAYLTTLVGGRCVRLELSREEVFASTRCRHGIDYEIETGVRADGTFVTRRIKAVSNQGAYASHGHAIVMNGLNAFRQTYPYAKAYKGEALTVYTNTATGGAMRGYGIPQANFAIEAHTDDIARVIGVDSIELRLKNCMRKGFKDPVFGIDYNADGITECINRGREAFDWDRKLAEYSKPDNKSGNVRRGIGLSIFTYKTGVYPISLETASARLILNQDGSVQLQVGATEIGQGSDTALSQIAAEVLDLPFEMVHIVSTQDTDVTPFDTGAYASRQTYVTGMAVMKCAELLKTKILDYAGFMLSREPQTLELIDCMITDQSGERLITLSEVALESFYNLKRSQHITAEITNHCETNAFSSGVCFAEVEVDMAIGKVKVLGILNVHDSGRLINPKLAEAQVHGGMSMGLGYALSEYMRYDDKGRLLNGNMLDYKLPTSMDTPDLSVAFYEADEPSGPYGNKALGEPPAIPGAAAIRNAVLMATGIAYNELPLTPQRLFEAGLGEAQNGGHNV